tara:strand:- start:264 stop:557 length:294 start_codon:yes stop_codon:yes gene_type:complete
MPITLNFKKINFDHFEKFLSENDIHASINDIAWKKNEEHIITLGDLKHMHISQGSENLYLDIDVYKLNEYNAHTMHIYTKDNHKGLKDLIIKIIKSL